MKKTLGIILLLVLLPIILLVGFISLTLISAEIGLIMSVCGDTVLIIAGIVAVVFLIRYLKNK